MTAAPNQTLQADGTGGWKERREDYALRYVPAEYRRWGPASLTGVMVGVATAMFFLAWGGELATLPALPAPGTATLPAPSMSLDRRGRSRPTRWASSFTGGRSSQLMHLNTTQEER
jgi:hypothetical protein